MKIDLGVINLVGDFDLSNRADVRGAFDAVKAPVRINLEDVTYIDASILGELARFARRVSPYRLALLAPQPMVRRMLDVVEFHRLFDY